MKFWFVVPAAGIGSRFGGDVPKQYRTVCGKRIIEHTLERLISLEPEGILVAVSPDDALWSTLPICRHPLVSSVDGGGERADSVMKALGSLRSRAGEDDWVLVHDVARPCVRAEDIARLIHGVKDSSVGGILAMPVSDTLKQVGTDFHIEQTRDRSTLWAAMTPQMFPLGLLMHSLDLAKARSIVPTDEAMAVELAGFAPLVVPGSRDNIKITRPEDLAIAEAILRWQQQPSGSSGSDPGGSI